MALTRNGVSTTTELGQERFETYYSDVLKRELVQYDYRHTDGVLFSCVANTLEKCRTKRNVWLAARKPLNN